MSYNQFDELLTSYRENTRELAQYDTLIPIEYLISKADKFTPVREYWEVVQMNVDFKLVDRSACLRWYTQVSEQKKLPITSLIRAIYLMDYYFSIVPHALSNPLLQRGTLKTWNPYVIPAVILDISSKIDFKKLLQCVNLTFACQPKDLLDLELSVLQSLDYNVTMPTAPDFISAFAIELYGLDRRYSDSFISPVQMMVSPIKPAQKRKLQIDEFMANAQVIALQMICDSRNVGITQQVFAGAAILKCCSKFKDDRLKKKAIALYERYKVDYAEIWQVYYSE